MRPADFVPGQRFKSPILINLDTPDDKTPIVEETRGLLPDIQNYSDAHKNCRPGKCTQYSDVSDGFCLDDFTLGACYDGLANSEDSRLVQGIGGYPEYGPEMSQNSFSTDKEIELREELMLQLSGFDPFGDHRSGGKAVVGGMTANVALDSKVEACATSLTKELCLYMDCEKKKSVAGEENQNGGKSAGEESPNGEKLVDIRGTSGDSSCRKIMLPDSRAGFIVMIKGVEFNPAHLSSRQKFGISPFAIDLTHPDAPFSSVVALYGVLRELMDEDKQRAWFVHDHPTRLDITGGALHNMFAVYSDFNIDVVNATVRLFHAMDDELYASYSDTVCRHFLDTYTESRCRHFLPYDFASTVRSRGDVLQLRQMFASYHITYPIGECKMILAPVLVDDVWSLYVWKFDRRAVIMIDPVVMRSGSHAVLIKHRRILDELHAAMTSCKAQFFPTPMISMENWCNEFLSVEDAHCDRLVSGLYTMFDAWYYDENSYKDTHICRCWRTINIIVNNIFYHLKKQLIK